MKTNTLYTYQTPEFEKYQKTALWYISFGIIGLLLLGYAIISRSPMMFVVFVLTFIITLLISNKDPQPIQVDITTTGIVLNSKRIFQYQDIESFGIFEKNQIRFISLYLDTGVFPYARIPLGNQKVEDITAILEQYIPREDGKENFFDTLDHFFKI
jgi:hypothetical protein